MAQVLKYDPETSVTLKVDSAATIAEGELVAVDAQGEAVLADSDGAAGPLKAVGFAVRAASGASGDYVTVAPLCVIGGLSSKTPGATQYASGTAGALTETRPTGATAAIQPVGIAISATKVLGNVTAPFALRQNAGTTTLA